MDKERRKVKQDLIQQVFDNHFSKDYKLTHTIRQQRADAKQIAEQLLAGKNPSEVVRL